MSPHPSNPDSRAAGRRQARYPENAPAERSSNTNYIHENNVTMHAVRENINTVLRNVRTVRRKRIHKLTRMQRGSKTIAFRPHHGPFRYGRMTTPRTSTTAAETDRSTFAINLGTNTPELNRSWSESCVKLPVAESLQSRALSACRKHSPLNKRGDVVQTAYISNFLLLDFAVASLLCDRYRNKTRANHRQTAVPKQKKRFTVSFPYFSMSKYTFYI